MSTDTMDGRTALVTGASSGIGRELSRVAAADGYDVVITARREERLQTLADEIEAEHGVSATVITQDLADPSGPDELFEAVRNAGIELHTWSTTPAFPSTGRSSTPSGRRNATCGE